jgi:hypothetical protein
VVEKVIRESKERVLKSFPFLKNEQVSKVNLTELGQK